MKRYCIPWGLRQYPLWIMKWLLDLARYVKKFSYVGLAKAIMLLM